MGGNIFNTTVAQLTRLFAIQEFRYNNVSDGAMALRRFIPLIVISTVLYLPICWTLKAWYKNRPAFPHKVPVFLWNLTLSLISALGSVVIILTQPEIMMKKADPCDPYDGSMGIHPYSAIVVRLFCITKFIEFGDTFWLCAKKRPTIFLHLYHHITVTLYCLHACLLDCPFGHFFAFVNLNIHAIMYGYYAASIIFKGNKHLIKLRPFITLGQLTQMFMGAAICLAELCSETPVEGLEINAFLGLVMYVSYAYLFGEFFVKNYKKHLNSISVLCSFTPPVLGIMMAVFHGWDSLRFFPGWLAVSMAIIAVVCLVVGEEPLMWLSPISYIGEVARKNKMEVKPSARCIGKIKGHELSGIRSVAIYSALPVLSIMLDSINLTRMTTRTIPLIFLIWSVHSYVTGSWEIEQVAEVIAVQEIKHHILDKENVTPETVKTSASENLAFPQVIPEDSAAVLTQRRVVVAAATE